MVRSLGAKYTESRARAIAAAELVISNPRISHAAAADQFGVQASTSIEIYLILTRGTPEEIAAFRANKLGVKMLCKAIRARQTDHGKMRKVPAPTPEKHREVRIRAFRAARLAITDGLSIVDAAKREDCARHSVGQAIAVLRFCTAQQIADAESGAVPLADLMEAIRTSTSKASRQRKPAARSQDAREQMATESAISLQLMDSLEAISGLPRPADVIAFIRKHHKRTEAVNKHLIAAFGWITEFSDEWTK